MRPEPPRAKRTLQGTGEAMDLHKPPGRGGGREPGESTRPYAFHIYGWGRHRTVWQPTDFSFMAWEKISAPDGGGEAVGQESVRLSVHGPAKSRRWRLLPEILPSRVRSRGTP